MQLGAHAEKKIVGEIDPAPIGRAQPIFAHEMRGRERAFFEINDPEQILVIAQTAAAPLHVRLLEIDVVRKFLVSARLVFHARGDVFPLLALHAAFPETRPEALVKLLITGEKTRFEHRGFGEHLRVRLRERFA